MWTADGRVRVRIPPAYRGPAVVARSPDGSLLATGSEDGVARVYDAATGRLEQTLAGHRAAIRSILEHGVPLPRSVHLAAAPACAV